MVNRFPAYLEVTGKLRLRFSRGRAPDQIGGLLRGQGFSPSFIYAVLLRQGDSFSLAFSETSTRMAVQGCTSEPLGQMRYRGAATPEFVKHWLSDHSGLSTLHLAAVVAFERNDELPDAFLRTHTGRSWSGPIHYIPTSNDFARAILLGFGCGMLPEQQSTEEIATGRLVDLAPRSAVDVPLYWQRWNLSSPLLDSVSAAVRAEARASLRPF